jgi:hypothetical protein
LIDYVKHSIYMALEDEQLDFDLESMVDDEDEY